MQKSHHSADGGALVRVLANPLAFYGYFLDVIPFFRPRSDAISGEERGKRCPSRSSATSRSYGYGKLIRYA
jgi:hypothetical protein